MTSNTGPIIVFPRIQPFGSDKLSSLGKVYSRHVTGSANCANSSVSIVMNLTSTVVRKPASVQLLMTDLVVEAFPLVLCTFATHFLVQELQSKDNMSLPIILLARKVGQIVLPTRVSPYLFDKYCIPLTNLILSRSM